MSSIVRGAKGASQNLVLCLEAERHSRGTREQLHAILESKRSEIPEFIYQAAKGGGARGMGGSSRPEGGR